MSMAVKARASDELEVVGLDYTSKSEEASVESLKHVLRTASRGGLIARFMRLGGPDEFREGVTKKFEEGGEHTLAYRSLLDVRIPKIQFLLANPFREPFLRRMDLEEKKTWDIWQVKDDVLEFAGSLLDVDNDRRRQKKRNRLSLAFHGRELLWNLSIAGDKHVVARSYYEAHTGHDANIADLHLRSGSESRFAESLIAYYESVLSDGSTLFVLQPDDIKRLGEWPSLFKANAVSCERSEQPAASQTPLNTARPVTKRLLSKKSGEAEQFWLGTATEEAEDCGQFNPVRLIRAKIPEDFSTRGSWIEMQRIDAIPSSTFLYAVQNLAAAQPDLVAQFEAIASTLVKQAFTALEEFRVIWEQKDRDDGCAIDAKPYPWHTKLKEAILEAGRFVTKNNNLISGCCREAEKLAGELDQKASHPFRDAHLKNRLIKFDEKLLDGKSPQLRRFLDQIRQQGIETWLSENTYDVDFETGGWLVTEWDDCLHILCSPNLGVACGDLAERLTLFLSRYYETPCRGTKRRQMYVTLLCRSLRELCRRIWYANVMPKTYNDRYFMERRERFLELARYAVLQVGKCPNLSGFLTECWANGKYCWEAAGGSDDWQEPIVALHSTVATVKPGYPYSVFISHSHRDKSFVEKLHARLDDEGVETQCYEFGLRVGEKIEKWVRDAIGKSDRLILVLSDSSMNSEWVSTEIRIFMNEKRELQNGIVPVAIVSMDKVQKWSKFDADSGEDLAKKIREYKIADFSNWREPADFNEKFRELLESLRQ